MKEIRRRRITVTSSSNEISTDQLGYRMVVRGKERRYYAAPTPVASRA